jgi:hypothetical protein
LAYILSQYFFLGSVQFSNSFISAIDLWKGGSIETFLRIGTKDHGVIETRSRVTKLDAIISQKIQQALVASRALHEKKEFKTAIFADMVMVYCIHSPAGHSCVISIFWAFD